MDEGELRLKGRIAIHVNRDSEKELIRGECAYADMMGVRLVLAIGKCMGFTFGTGDIKGPLMQSERIEREVYVKLPRDLFRPRGIL